MDVKSAVETAREACAREIEWMARGYAAYECGVLRKIAKTIRALPLSATPAEMILVAMRLVHSEKVYVPHADGACIMAATERLLGMDPADPMEPFDDRLQWWPRAERRQSEIAANARKYMSA